MLELTPIVLVAVGIGVVAAAPEHIVTGDIAVAFANIAFRLPKITRSSTC